MNEPEGSMLPPESAESADSAASEAMLNANDGAVSAAVAASEATLNANVSAVADALKALTEAQGAQGDADELLARLAELNERLQEATATLMKYVTEVVPKQNP